jgi:molybdopterin converting factor small subunit
MRITVKLGEPLWRQVGERTLQLQWARPSITVDGVLRRLEREYPGFGPAFRGDELGAVYPYSLFVNSRLVRREHARQTRLQDGDKLFIFIPVVGG